MTYKILIYSSEELYNDSSYEGRAEADLIAVAIEKIIFSYTTGNILTEKRYLVNKSKIPAIYASLSYSPYKLKRLIEKAEERNFNLALS